jgi:pilus assembly protein Flp/PilA
MMAALVLARRLFGDETAATAIEYALLAALIAGVLIGTVAGLGTTVMKGLFETASSQLESYLNNGS